MTIIKLTNQTLVGIDIGKSEHAVAISKLDEPIQTLMVKNTPKDRQEFVKSLGKMGKCSVAMEQIGGWATPLDQQLLSAGHQVLTIHPLRLAQAREMYGQMHKDDEKDARFLLWLLKELKQGFIPEPEAKRFQVIIPCQPNYKKLKTLARHYRALSWSKVQTSNQLVSLILCYLPNLQTVYKKLNCLGCLTLLSNSPCPSTWVKIHGHKMKAWFRKVYQRNISSIQLKKIKQFAWSGNWEPLTDETALQLKHLAKKLILLDGQKKEVEDRLAELMETLPEAQALMTLPGCGLILTATILAELSPIERFKSHNQIATYVGLTRARYESGVRKNTRKIKLVNRKAKWAFRQLMLLNLQMCPVSQEYLEKKLEQGKTKRQARLALGRQLVKVVLALIKTKQPFDPDR
jgi:transposase